MTAIYFEVCLESMDVRRFSIDQKLQIHSRVQFIFKNISEILNESDPERLAFIDRCCRTEPCAASFVHLLRETQKQDLSNLNGIMTRARGALNGPEYEKMHQLWQNEKQNVEKFQKIS